MTTQIEQRAAPLEIRATGRTLEGYAAVFNQPTDILDFTETIAPGAFQRSLREGDVLGLVDHDPGKLLARTRNNTLKLAEDSTGLHFEMMLPDTTLARDIRALAEAGSIGGASFGFQVVDDAWKGNLRTLRDVNLREISVVSAWPAYPQTSVSARHRPDDSAMARAIRILELGVFS